MDGNPFKTQDEIGLAILYRRSSVSRTLVWPESTGCFVRDEQIRPENSGVNART
jgi:hypothetical protein